MTGFDDKQLTDLRAPLAREYVRGRNQAGRQVSYLEGWHCIAEANRIFGFDGWDRETVDCRCVAEREVKMGQNKDRDGWRVAYVGKVRVTVRAGDQVIVREGTGYGSGIDADPGEAHESAIKECETDCMKRALMTFGNPFGLALYDKKQENVETAPRALERPNPTSAAPAEKGAAATSTDQSRTRSSSGNGSLLPPNPEEPPEVNESRKRFAAILKALREARDEKTIDEIWNLSVKDVALIKKHGGNSALGMLHEADQKRRDALRTGAAA